MEFLLWSTGRAVLELVSFADGKVKQGVMSKKRVIVPGMKRMKKWILASIGTEDSSADHAPDTSESTRLNIEVGDAYRKSRDPEHLPPANAWQSFGNGVRAISRILGSQESAFGFRVACATLSIGIVAFLRDGQRLFIQQRLVWAMIMVAIGMTVTAGAGVFGFIGRVTGTSKAASLLAIGIPSLLSLWLIESSHCNVHELSHLVYRGRQDAWYSCATFCLHILRILLRVEIPPIHRYSHHFNGHSSLSDWL